MMKFIRIALAAVLLYGCGGIDAPEATGRQHQAQAVWTGVYTSNNDTVVMAPASQYYCGVVHLDNNGGQPNGAVDANVFIRPSDHVWVNQTNGATTVGARCISVLSFGTRLRGIVTSPSSGLETCPQGQTCPKVAMGVNTRTAGCYLNTFATFLNGSINNVQNQAYAAPGNQAQPWYSYESSITPPSVGEVEQLSYCPLFSDPGYVLSWVVGLNESYNPSNTVLDSNTVACFISGNLGNWQSPTVVDIDQFDALKATIGPGTNANTQANYTCVILNP